MLGKVELDHLLAEREKLNESPQQIIDDQTEPWGIKVSVVEIKDVEIPERMQQAIARQAEAERNRRAKVINAEGEFQAADRLAQAADVIRPNPVTMQLRYLQALTDISSNQASTIVFPLPLDLIKPLVEPRDQPKQEETEEARRRSRPWSRALRRGCSEGRSGRPSLASGPDRSGRHPRRGRRPPSRGSRARTGRPASGSCRARRRWGRRGGCCATTRRA